MPRKRNPKRELAIIMDEESIRDAMALWVKKYHGIEIDAKKIEVSTDGILSATFAKPPQEPNKEKSDDRTRVRSDYSEQQVDLLPESDGRTDNL
jgi:hypothetical protein